MTGLFEDEKGTTDAAEQLGAKVTPIKLGEINEPLAVVSIDFQIKGYNGMFVLKDVDELILASRLEQLMATFEARDDIQPYQRWSKGSSSAAAQGQSQTFEAVQFVLQKRTDGKYEIQLYPQLGDGSIGQYPELQYVADRDGIWEKFGEVLKPYNIKADELPAKRACKWSVGYVFGKPTGKTDKTGQPTFYRDFQSVSPIG
jgi:hypothetical protein